MRAAVVAALCLLLLVAGLPATLGQGGDQAPQILSFQVAGAPIDIADVIGKPDGSGITFTVNARHACFVHAAQVLLWREVPEEERTDDDLVHVTLRRVSGGPTSSNPCPGNDPSHVEVWRETMRVEDRRLTTGSWDALAIAYSASGQHAASPAASFEVEAEGVRPPEILLADLEDAFVVPEQILGASDFLRFNIASKIEVDDDPIDITSRIMKKATYQLQTGGGPACGFLFGQEAPGCGPELEFKAPYVLFAHSFMEGPQRLHVRAYDRAHNMETISLDVFVDTIEPKVNVTVAPGRYAGVPFDVAVETEDASLHEVIFTLGPDVRIKDAAPPGGVTTFDVEVAQPGTIHFTVIARDIAGNEAPTVLRTVNVEPAFTVLAMGEVRVLEDWPYPAPTETGVRMMPVRFEANITQVDGLVEMPVTLTYSATGGMGSVAATVPVGETVTVPIEDIFLPGRHTLLLEVSAPDAVEVVQNGSVLQASVQFEVFLGKVLHGEDEYFIRADAMGMPVTAIDPETGRTYPLTLVQRGVGSVYEFTAGDEGLYWDPLHITTIVPLQVDEEKEAPAVGLLLVLVLVGLAARLRRRRD